MTVNKGMCAEKMAYKATTNQNLPNLAGIAQYFQLNIERKKAHPPKNNPKNKLIHLFKFPCQQNYKHSSEMPPAPLPSPISYAQTVFGRC